MKNIFLISIVLVLTNCKMKPEKPNVAHSLFQETHKHAGSENYEIVEIFDKKFEVKKIELDTHSKQAVIYGKTNPTDKEKFISNRVKTSILGDITGEGITNAEIEKDGSMHGFDFYSNWIIDGDTIKHRYIDPFSNEEINDPYAFKADEENPAKWLAKFKEVYDKASYVYESSWNYFLKIDKEWYFIKYNLDLVNDAFVKNYPPKQEQPPRMLELENLAPIWYHKSSKERDTSLIKMIDYKSTFYTEEKFGLVKRGYSAGWWYLEVYMPLGDTLRIKRYSDFEDPDLKLYQIPAAYGGRNDVLFIVQKPEKLFPEQVGGMYVIRPRDAQQPDRRYKSISYGDMLQGQPYILKSEETEEYKNWKMEQKG
ncbi:hypothetical protein SAMN05421636_105300 [Pricia antarctica]|uniref:Uncharacterized protein n=2 Tax=Pricia antarctica TaxID=641691 RepID=A0A1G7DFA2_9FLAO|nr:hypothetical protein SAMN05421636_105300 [Pricia antarctica]